jgi:tetratricopeptide (TPR) repeat protein
MNKIKIKLSVGLFLVSIGISPLFAQKYFNYTGLVRQAYDKTMSLQLDEANALLTKAKSLEPNNLAIYHIENYQEFLRLYITENTEDYDLQRKNLDRRIAKIQEGSSKSPYFLFIQANMRLQWAMLRIRFGEYWSAFTEASKAHKLLKRNQELFPGFMPNYKDLGLLHAIVGVIPDNYKWGVRLLGGLTGTIAQGRIEIEKVLRFSQQNDFIFSNETVFFQVFLLLHLENDPEAAWAALQSTAFDPQKNLLHCFVKANVAMRSGKNDEAIRLLSARPKTPGLLPFAYLDFMQGVAKLRRLDGDSVPYFQNFLAQFKGQNYIKEAYQKLAWTAILRNDTEGYRRNMELCKQKGKTAIGPDKNAEEEANQNLPPEPILLKARLLFDGGYFQKASELLLAKNENDFKTPILRLEYTYRLARIQHGLKKYDVAIKNYQITLEKGARDPHYFACNAALQLGLVYEELHQKETAKKYFQRCLQLKPEDYRTSLHQAAKAGMERVK